MTLRSLDAFLTSLIKSSAMIAIILLCCVPGCQTRTSEGDMRIDKLFEGYRVLLIDNIPKDFSIRDMDTTTLHNAYPVDTIFKPGRVYLLRKITDQSNYDLGMTVLPNRLRQYGAKIISAPQSPGQFTTIFVGGPLFKIEFEKNGHHGMICNRAYGSEIASENWDELIVLWE